MPPGRPELKPCSGTEPGPAVGGRERTPGWEPGTTASRFSAATMFHATAGGDRHLDLDVQDFAARLCGGPHLHAFGGPDPEASLAVSGEPQQVLNPSKMGKRPPCAGQQEARD